MKISYKCDYALKIILDLADFYPKHFVHRSDIARRQDIPEKFLEQILRLLMQGGFVQSKKGPNGGYFLVRPPKDIILGEVIRCIEGSMYPISCIDPDAPPTCNFIPKCVFYDIWQDVGEAISNIIDHVNFAQLQQKAVALRGQGALIYYI